MGISTSINGRSGGSLSNRSVTVAAGYTGVLPALTAPLASPITYSKLSGSASITNIATGVPSLTSALAAGASVSAIVRAVSGVQAVEYQLTVTGVTPTPSANPQVQFAAAQISQPEGDSAIKAFTFTIQRNTSIGAAGGTYAFDRGGTDSADYPSGLPTGGTYSFADGVNTTTVTITTSGDTSFEADESFSINLQPPAGYSLVAPSTATGTILNDDVLILVPDAPSIAVAAGNAQAVITITDGSTGGSAITAHKIYRGLSAGNETLIATYPASSGLIYTDNLLTNGTTYFYKVTAVNVAGESARSNSASGAPSAASGLTPNQQMLAALPPRPKVGVLGGSRERQNAATAGTQTRTMPSGDIAWAEALDPLLFQSIWGYSNQVDANSNGLTGFLFANDGDGPWNVWQRIAAFLASDADVAVVAISSNAIQFNDFDIYQTDLNRSITAANLVSLYQQICLKIIQGGKPVIFKELWERGVYRTDGTAIGGPWTSGSSPRAVIAPANSTMKSWCATQGIPFLEVRAAMTTTQVNGSNNDVVPIAAYVRDDSTHLSTMGGKKMGELHNALFSNIFTRASSFTDEGATNYAVNPTFTGTGGTLSAGFEAGSIAPDNMSITRNSTGTTSKVTTSIETDGQGARWLVFSIDRSTMLNATDQESLQFIVPSTVPNDATKSYVSRVRCKVAAGTWRGTPNTFIGSCWTMIPMDNGGSGVTNPTAAMNALTLASETVLTLKSMPQALSAAANLRVTSPSWRKDDGSPLTFKVALPEIRTIQDLHLYMYNEQDTAAPTLSSSANISGPEESSFTSFVTTNKPARLSLTGNDAAQFTIDKSGRLRMNSVPDYEVPVDVDLNNVYDLGLVMQSFNPTVAATTTPMTVTVADIPDGTVYRFTATNGTDIADLYPTVTRSGTTGAVTVSSNAAKNNNAIALTRYFFPAEATGGNCEVRWAATSGASTAPGIMVRVDPATLDRVSVSFVSNQVQVGRVKAGVAQTALTYSFYTSPSAGTQFIAQIINNVLRVYQNGVELTPSAGVDCTGCAESSNISGISSSTSSGNVGSIDNFNPRPAVARTSKVVLKALTLANDVLAAGTVYAGTVGAYTGSPNMIVTSDTSGLFFVDGFNLRSQAPLGASGTVYTVTVSEDNANAVNAPKTTAFTITVP
jgi:hypothetical protein